MGRNHGFSEEDYAKARKQSIKQDRAKSSGISPNNSTNNVLSEVPPKKIKEQCVKVESDSIRKRFQRRLSKVLKL